jgi:hypothetical protein
MASKLNPWAVIGKPFPISDKAGVATPLAPAMIIAVDTT